MSLPNAFGTSNVTLAAAAESQIIGIDQLRRRVWIGNNTGGVITVGNANNIPSATNGIPIPAGQSLFVSYDDNPALVTSSIHAFSTPGGAVTVWSATVAQ